MLHSKAELSSSRWSLVCTVATGVAVAVVREPFSSSDAAFVAIAATGTGGCSEGASTAVPTALAMVKWCTKTLLLAGILMKITTSSKNYKFQQYQVIHKLKPTKSLGFTAFDARQMYIRSQCKPRQCANPKMIA